MTRYAQRRSALLAQLPPGAIAIVATAPVAIRNGDAEYLYRFDSNFYYLSGFTEPDSVLVLIAASSAGAARSILFCREKNVLREIWDGYRYGTEEARRVFGFDAAYPIDELDTEMRRLLAASATPQLYYAPDGSLAPQITLWQQAAAGSGSDLSGLLAEMRMFKDEAEQATMQRAATIASAGHVRAMRSARAGIYEYQLEAELLYEFRRHGAQAPAYTSIVAAGANACVLHYSANNAQSQDGDLILIDAGCELDGYAADISRTYPVNGRFSGPQAALYELVLAAQTATLERIKPGLPFQQIHETAVQVLAQGMLDLGLLDRQRVGGVEDVIAHKNYTQFYMHGTSHWLGLDVHDVGEKRDMRGVGQPSRQLQSGMVLTVEPGIYVRPAAGVPEQFWNIGIRIEDDVLLTEAGHTVLSSAAPKTVAEIEQLMRHG